MSILSINQKDQTDSNYLENYATCRKYQLKHLVNFNIYTVIHFWITKQILLRRHSYHTNEYLSNVVKILTSNGYNINDFSINLLLVVIARKANEESYIKF